MGVAALVSHLTWCERGWFAASFPGIAGGEVARDESGGWDFPRKPLALLVEEYEAECDVSRRVVAGVDLETVQEFTPAQFAPVTVRWILAHMIDETARHLGHLDVLREQLDGTRSY
jgi:hypothetical protein